MQLRLGQSKSFLKTETAHHNWNDFTCLEYGFLQLKDLLGIFFFVCVYVCVHVCMYSVVV